MTSLCKTATLTVILGLAQNASRLAFEAARWVDGTLCRGKLSGSVFDTLLGAEEAFEYVSTTSPLK